MSHSTIRVLITLTMDIERVGVCLNTRSWNGTRPVIVFIRCEGSLHTLIPMIRNRQRKQAIIWWTDGEYMPALDTLADVTVTIGSVPSSWLKVLTNKPYIPTIDRYKMSVDRSDLYKVIQQIHLGNSNDLNMAIALSDTDIMLHHVPDEYILHTLPTINPNQTYGMLDTRRGEHELI